MINGYVNIPSELSSLDLVGSVSEVIPGIYNKMSAVLELNKPVVGTFTYRGLAFLMRPAIYKVEDSIHCEFTMGTKLVGVTVNELDQVNTI